MQESFKITQTSRKILASFLEQYTVEQLHKIPDGFSNNLIWNIGHVIVTEQLLVYKLSGLPMMVTDEMVEKYRKGTKPSEEITENEVKLLQELLFATINQTQKDFENGVFKNYQEYPTSTGFVLQNVKDAIAFNNLHEGIHLGIILGLRKFI
ncbi:hypothetical protein B0A58_00460 [Flavobacterium branchiophilum NBRC 15030 = ATCC 35035]|uniref:DinB family protein n=1 Tax=Flavobacterium branchiophilum TaxID=55197 RepID=A0A543G3U5_9FLAO|nr:DinB family protein [Flavobacterium branchiophilum]OXA82191.1 hypothetical protein B0A58_00460 [Flavobacterium branchiophilum NBRC 15030 = ATCC 35035]TQM40751.1 DinB family protein [Flavobacterium branchiophilum]GEM55411.1 hypothetical protein FB1_16320 [Flavobacterium branchiophilum NBRC 15030 = ATCC 35035]